MFEQLLKDPRALARHRQGPLAEQRQRYLAHCAEQQMARSVLRAIASYLLAIARYLRLDERPDDLIGPAEIQAQADRWEQRPTNRARAACTHGSRKHFVTHATHWLQFLGRFQPPAAGPHADRVAAFAEYMRRERGLSPSSIDSRCWVAQRFLDSLCASRPLEEITPAHVDDALMDWSRQGGLRSVSVKVYAAALRAFFRFAQTRQWCRPGLAEAIHRPRVFSQDGLPAGPSWDDVQRLLAAADGDAPVAVRDLAILLLLAVYSCRAGEVVRLRLDDLDWEKELIQFTRPKSARAQTFPLSRPVGDAILRYLQNVRPRSPHREVFLRLNAPHGPLTSGALWYIVGPRLRALGLSLRHYGPHALRHACATHLLEQGFTLKQIGDHLGHRDPDTTRIYAKVDLNELRQVADFDLGDLP